MVCRHTPSRARKKAPYLGVHHKNNNTILNQAVGFTLVELLVTLSITAILTSIAVPSFAHLYQLSIARSVTDRMITLVNYARLNAVNSGKMTTLCPSQDNLNCSKDWAEGIILFIDEDENGEVNNEETVLTTLDPLPDESSLSWHAFPRKSYLQYTNEGFTNEQNGRFSYCPSNGEKTYWRQIIISKTGRPRLAIPDELKNHC